jgi:WD40 repeat protein
MQILLPPLVARAMPHNRHASMRSFIMYRFNHLVITLIIQFTWLSCTPVTTNHACAAETGAEANALSQVSYYKQIRPLFQAKCQGCHQPAKAKGKYIMTAFEHMLKGGSSKDIAIVPGKPAESNLLALITPIDGEAEMPQKAPPLHSTEIALIEKWIKQGAKDDTPENAKQRIDKDHPPVYTRPPVISSLDFSPKGDLLAISGFHEVLLINTKDWSQVGRLIGVAQRIESVSFSPDGTKLAVSGGLPARMGEIQVWDVAKQKLELSIPITYDTVYGVSWSPDSTKIAFGCGDNTVRAIDAKTGKQLVFMAAHGDWAQGTVFSMDNKSIFSVSRDKTVKQTDVATQRFIGNVTTHTPGVLRGGMLAIARHPKRNELLAGGADGAAKLFRMTTKAAPAGGGNPNQIRQYKAMPGRVFDVSFNHDGTHAFAGSSFDNSGEVRGYETDTGKEAWKFNVTGSGIYALACAPDGKLLAAGGADGLIRLIDTAKGTMSHSFVPVVINKSTATTAGALAFKPAPIDNAQIESLPKGTKIVSVEVQPATITITKPTDYVQVIVSAKLDNGNTFDITRTGKWQVSGEVGSVSSLGLFSPIKNGQGKIIANLAGQRIEVPVQVSAFTTNTTAKNTNSHKLDFIRDVNPVLSRLGCNAGTCHGSAKGKAGFKLSLRGYDAIFDIRAFTDDHASRRVNVAAPDSSLMLMKATGAVPHEGAQLFTPGSRYYHIVRNWIADGAQLNLDAVRVASIEVLPKNPILQLEGHRQAMRIVATYTDGSKRDVTREAFVTSGDTEIAMLQNDNILLALRRGEAPVLARYEGAYAATTLTVMGDRTGFSWQQPQAWGTIDKLVAAKWKHMKIQPSQLCTDAEFIRRIYLDLTGLPPSTAQVTAFIADKTPTQKKRDALVDALVGDKEYVEHWTNKWADLLQVNRKFLAPQGAAAFRGWIRNEIETNTPYDQFAKKILTADGSNKTNPAASYYKILRDPALMMENTTHLFLGVRFNCNKCHDHPFERWTQDQYYETAAYFARVGLKADPKGGKGKIGGSAVEKAKPLYEVVFEKPTGEITHDRTQKITPPQFPFKANFQADEKATRRQTLAAWITSPDNQYFARSYVNRLWGYLLGTGIREPIDDLRAGNPPTNPQLLEYLASQFVESKFDARHMMKIICKSRTYQLSFRSNKWNDDDKINFSHRIPRRLPAEVLFDTVHRVTGSQIRIPGIPAGARAAAIPDSGVKVPGGFLGTFGRPTRESACECERSNDINLGPVMALISGPTIANAIADNKNALGKLVTEHKDDKKLINAIYLRILNRPATEKELQVAITQANAIENDHALIVAQAAKIEAKFAAELKQKNDARNAAITKAKTNLDNYIKQIAPKRAAMAEQRQTKITNADKASKAYLANYAKHVAQTEAALKKGTVWAVINPKTMKSTNGAKLTKEKDGSIFVTGKEGKTVYELIAETGIANITGIRIEALVDKRIPRGGPGRSAGNFVLSEFELHVAKKATANKFTKIALQNAKADFNQKNYNITTAIDGKAPATNNGWAIAGATNKNHTAIFETKTNAASASGAVLKFLLNQQYTDGKHSLGKFRISVTNSPRPIGLNGPPKNIAAILKVEPAKRNKKQNDDLTKFIRAGDGKLKQLQVALANAKKPLPQDVGEKQRRDALSKASIAVPIDPDLLEIRRIAQTSDQQMKNRRLTIAQDVSWVLINSPAFLFNR